MSLHHHPTETQMPLHYLPKKAQLTLRHLLPMLSTSLLKSLVKLMKSLVKMTKSLVDYSLPLTTNIRSSPVLLLIKQPMMDQRSTLLLRRSFDHVRVFSPNNLVGKHTNH